MSPVYHVAATSTDEINEEVLESSCKDMHKTRKKPNTAERIEIIRRTLRRQSTSNAPVQPPKHSIMAGFAGFLNMTTATCNTGVPSERRMSIPVVINDDDKKLPESPSISLPYSNLPPIGVSEPVSRKDSVDLNSCMATSHGVGGIGKLRTRWSDTNMFFNKVEQVRRSSSNTIQLPDTCQKTETDQDKRHYHHSISIPITKTQNERERASPSSAIISEKICDDQIKTSINRSRIRSDSIATTIPELSETILSSDFLDRERNNSDPFIMIRVTGKSILKHRFVMTLTVLLECNMVNI